MMDNTKPECHAVRCETKKGRVFLLIEDVDDPNIVEFFAEAFAEATIKAELIDDNIRKITTTRIRGSVIPTRLFRAMEKAGFGEKN